MCIYVYVLLELTNTKISVVCRNLNGKHIKPLHILRIHFMAGSGVPVKGVETTCSQSIT